MAIRTDGLYIDATFGRGGHAEAVLAELGGQGRLICLDRDPEAIAEARRRFGDDPRVAVHHTSFAHLERLAHELSFAGRVDGLLLDLGVSSPQLDDPGRGFGFQEDGPLDMRMDPTQGVSAAEWLRTADPDEIVRVLRDYGEERYARRIARAIADRRGREPIRTTGELAALIEAAAPTREQHKHPATRAFQALRIFINDELGALESVLEQSLGVLAPGGRLVVISFHSLEDRIVKRFVRDRSRTPPELARMPSVPDSARPALRPVGRPVRPDADEVRSNPRARSAVLRVAERLS